MYPVFDGVIVPYQPEGTLKLYDPSDKVNVLPLVVPDHAIVTPLWPTLERVAVPEIVYERVVPLVPFGVSCALALERPVARMRMAKTIFLWGAGIGRESFRC